MPKRLYFLGIGGTLMGSLALLAKEMGAEVSGFDRALYPPMSDQLQDAGIRVFEGFDERQLKPSPDLVVIGNAQLPRGHEAIECVLNRNLRYTSGAAWLGDHVLRDRWTIALAGTHGKTTTASLVAHILRQVGVDTGFLIGGVPSNFGVSAQLGTSSHFVVEADEYDTSYFDRRSKFVHYRPKTLVIGNLELDHADIFTDLGQIQTQFHHLLRTVPSLGLVVVPAADDNVNAVLEMGCWTPVARFGEGRPANGGDRWQARNVSAAGGAFSVWLNGRQVGSVSWPLIGEHNVNNALAALAATRHAGVRPEDGIGALASFRGVKRRMERIVDLPGLQVYDDFAHHPTAIDATLRALRARVGRERIVAVIEPRTHTMSLGTLREHLTTCCEAADQVIWFRGANIRWDVDAVAKASLAPAIVEHDIERLVRRIAKLDAGAADPCHVVLMSNGAFGGIYEKLKVRLRQGKESTGR